MTSVRSTEFRKNMFEVLDLVSHGQKFDIVYKGAKLTLSSAGGGSKLARVVRRNALQVDPESIVESDAALMGEFASAWAKSDKEL